MSREQTRKKYGTKHSVLHKLKSAFSTTMLKMLHARTTGLNQTAFFGLEIMGGKVLRGFSSTITAV